MTTPRARLVHSLLFASPLLLLTACSGGVTEPTNTTNAGEASEAADRQSKTPAPTKDHAQPATNHHEPEPLRVLVTGFNDWRELGDPPNIWRCRDNPSCRLLVGDERSDPPGDAWDGHLVKQLKTTAPEIDWSFRTMPVTWGAFAEVPRDYDLIINIGLGVYDRFDVLQLEAGAYNLRDGADAAGAEQPGAIAAPADATATTGEVLPPPEASPITRRLAAQKGRRVAGYEILVAEARPENSYLCNETHFNALSALHAPQPEQRLREVYFLHIPYAEDDDYAALAAGVAGVVLGLAEHGDDPS